MFIFSGELVLGPGKGRDKYVVRLFGHESCLGHTNGADDAGASELARRLVLGVEVGEPFGTGLAKGLVVQRAGHCVCECTVVEEWLAEDAPHLAGSRWIWRLTVAETLSV